MKDLLASIDRPARSLRHVPQFRNKFA